MKANLSVAVKRVCQTTQSFDGSVRNRPEIYFIVRQIIGILHYVRLKGN